VPDKRRPDEQEALRLVRSHQTGIWRYLRALGCDPILAEDLVQEVFLRCLTRPWPIPEGQTGNELAFFKTCARNLLIDHWRKHRREHSVSELEHLDKAWTEETENGDGSAEMDALAECLRGVPPRARRLLEIRYRDHTSMQAGAAELKMTEGAAKVALQRTRDQLRECIRRKLGRPS
jgi:RNA polymerase sigma-70 factor (ECF subfamily)